MTKKAIISAILALLAGGVYAQNLNPTVEVTNDYRSGFQAITRNDIPMIVPDSLLRFDRNFDYSTFETPYKGSYEFVPFSVLLKPDAGYYGDHRFWMCAGAGYSMYPVLNAYYEPFFAKSPDVKMSLWQKGDGYWGRYRDDYGSGYDFHENIGMDLRYTGKSTGINFGISYEGYFRSLSENRGMYNGAKLYYGMNSVPGKEKHAYYDFTATYRYGAFGQTDLNRGHDIELSGSAGPLLGKVFSIPIDFLGRYNSYNNSYVAWIAPHFKFVAGPMDLNAGAKVGIYREGAPNQMKFGVYPDVRLKIDIAKKYFTFYAVAEGGPEYYSRDQILELSHFDVTAEGMQNSEMDFYGGFRGAAGSIFQYDINGGFGFFSLLPFESIIPSCEILPCEMLPCTVYQGANMAHADAKLIFRSEDIDAEIGVHYKQAFYREEALGYDKSLITGSARAVYNYQQRVFAGLYVEGATKRTSSVEGFDEIPGFVNLGVYFEYKFTPRFSIWLEGRNLANMAIYRNPLYAERGVSGTVGICFSL